MFVSHGLNFSSSCDDVGKLLRNVTRMMYLSWSPKNLLLSRQGNPSQTSVPEPGVGIGIGVYFIREWLVRWFTERGDRGTQTKCVVTIHIVLLTIRNSLTSVLLSIIDS